MKLEPIYEISLDHNNYEIINSQRMRKLDILAFSPFCLFFTLTWVLGFFFLGGIQSPSWQVSLLFCALIACAPWAIMIKYWLNVTRYHTIQFDNRKQVIYINGQAWKMFSEIKSNEIELAKGLRRQRRLRAHLISYSDEQIVYAESLMWLTVSYAFANGNKPISTIRNQGEFSGQAGWIPLSLKQDSELLYDSNEKTIIEIYRDVEKILFS